METCETVDHRYTGQLYHAPPHEGSDKTESLHCSLWQLPGENSLHRYINKSLHLSECCMKIWRQIQFTD